MTVLTKWPSNLVAALVLVSTPLAAQESAAAVDLNVGPELRPISMVAGSGPVDIVEESEHGPDTVRAVSASSALFSGLDAFGAISIAPSDLEPSADGDYPDQRASGRVDAWGVAPNFGLAMGEILLAASRPWFMKSR